jgi:hypothetical protein
MINNRGNNMTSRDFCYWLQGFFEIHKAGKPTAYKMKHLDEDQIECIEKHLSMVFVHEIDPSYGDKEHQGKLNAIHSSPTMGGKEVHLQNLIVEEQLNLFPNNNLLARC